MAVKLRAALKADAETYIADNITKDISPADVRQRFIDFIDSAVLPEDLDDGDAAIGADLTFYVDAGAGDDANDGLSEETAFATLQKLATAAAAVNFGNYSVYGFLADGEYDGGTFGTAFEGIGLRGHGAASQLVIVGNTANPENVVLTGDLCSISLQYNAIEIHMAGVTYDKDVLIGAQGNLCVARDGKVRFAGGVSAHVFIVFGGNYAVWNADNMEIAGGPPRHIYADGPGSKVKYLCQDGETVTVTGAPDFSIAFVEATALACIDMGFYPPAFDGAATGARGLVTFNAVIKAGGLSPTDPNYFPGDSAVIEDTGGVYG